MNLELNRRDHVRDGVLESNACRPDKAANNHQHVEIIFPAALGEVVFQFVGNEANLVLCGAAEFAEPEFPDSALE